MYGLTTSPCTIQPSIGTFRTKARSLVQPEEGNTRLKERKAWIRKEENWKKNSIPEAVQNLMFAVLMCSTGNCTAQNMLLDPQLQTQLQLVFTPDGSEWSSQCTFCESTWKRRRTGEVDATHSRLDRSEDFLFLFRLFRCTFMALWWRTLRFGWCCTCQDPKKNTEQSRLGRELKYVFLLLSGVRKRLEMTARGVWPQRKFHWFTTTLSLKDYTKTTISCDLYRCNWSTSEAKVNSHNNCKSKTQVWSQAGKPPSSSNAAQLRPIRGSLHSVNNPPRWQATTIKMCPCTHEEGRELWGHGDWAVCTKESAAVPGYEFKNNETNSLTTISVPAAFPKQGHMAKMIQEANPSMILHAERLFPVIVIIFNYWVLHSLIKLETQCYKG